MKKAMMLIVAGVLLVACGSTPTPDMAAVQTQAARDFAATLTAEAPAATSTEVLPTNTSTPEPPTPTRTDTPTLISITPSAKMTAEPTSISQTQTPLPSLTPTQESTVVLWTPTPTEPMVTPVLNKPQGRIVFERGRGPTRVYIANADGTEEQLINNSFYDVEFGSWSPDGQWVAFSAAESSLSVQVYIMRPDGSGLAKLTDFPFGAWSPVWSPDGQRIAFTAEGDIWIMNSDGTGQHRVTNTPTAECPDIYVPSSWSPDGEWLGTQCGHANQSDIFVMRVDGSEVTNLSADQPCNKTDSDEVFVDWTPNGAWIVYNASCFDGPFDSTGYHHIWIMKSDGSQKTDLTPYEQAVWARGLSPDGWIRFYVGASGDLFAMKSDGSNRIKIISGLLVAWGP